MVKISAAVLGLAATVAASPVENIAARDVACGANFISGGYYYQLLCGTTQYGTGVGAAVRGGTPETCAAACESTAGCVVSAWDQAGYCHMASTKVLQNAGNWKTVVKGAAVSQPLNCAGGASAPSNGISYSVNRDTFDIKCTGQWYGADVANNPYRAAATFEDCIAYCSADSTCVDVVYSNAKYCFLKASRTGNFVSSDGWWTAVKRVQQN